MPQAILLQDVESLGERGTVIDVSPGYLRNYLLPRKLAEPATTASIQAARRRQEEADRAVREAEDRARDNAATLGRTVLTIPQQAGDDGRLFGSVTTQDISDAIREARGIKVDKRKIHLDDPIRNIGTYMVVIDVASAKVVGNVEWGHPVRPHMPIFGKDGMLYVTTELDKTISIIDPKTLTIVGTIPTGQPESHMLALSHDGQHGFTANVGPGTVSVLDIPGRKMVAVIPISKETQRISISTDDRWVFTADQTQPRLAVIDTATNKVGLWVALDGIAYGTAPTLDGKFLLVTIPKSGAVAVVDLNTMKVVRTVTTPPDPQEVLMRPGGKTAYVSCVGSHTIAEVDLTTWKVTRTIDDGNNSDGIAWAGR